MKTLRDNGNKAYLILYPIKSFAKPIPLKNSRTFIGRSHGDELQIQVDDRHVSRKHACIHNERGTYILEDLDSQNGTYLNNERIKRDALHSHDKITIGRRTYLFLVQPDATCGPMLGPSKGVGDTIAIRRDEIDFEGVWAQNADEATRGFLHQDVDHPPGSTPSSELARTRLSLLYQLSDQLRTTSNAAEVYEKGVELVMQAFPGADYALVAKRSASHDAFKILTSQFGDQRQAGVDSIPISHTVFDWVLTEKVTLVSENLVEDQRFQESESISINDLRSIVCAPIAGKKGTVALLYAQANNLASPFNREDAKFVSAVANEMALNIDNIRFQKEMLRSERMAAVGLTVSNLAHNLKNLLAVNQTAVQLMDSYIKENDYTRINQKWQWIKTSLDDISKLSTDMLAYVKDDDLQLSPVDVNALIATNLDAFESSLSNDGISLETALADQTIFWVVDEVRLKQALLNLVVNAADALKQKQNGRILISTSVSNDRHLVISVTDNGCGIPEDHKENVLDLFFSTKGSRGTGLGLSMVQKFVEKSGGRLTFETEEGRGSVFTMMIPEVDDGSRTQPSNRA